MAWERCPAASCSLPAACQLGLSYFWDLVPSLEKQTVALTVIPNKTPSFLSLNHVFQKSCPTGGLDAKCWVLESQWGEKPLTCKVEISTALQDGFPCGQGNIFCLYRGALANACPEMYTLSYNSSHKSSAKFAFTKKHCNY